MHWSGHWNQLRALLMSKYYFISKTAGPFGLWVTCSLVLHNCSKLVTLSVNSPISIYLNSDLSMRLRGINPTNSVVIRQSLVLRFIVRLNFNVSKLSFPSTTGKFTCSIKKKNQEQSAITDVTGYCGPLCQPQSLICCLQFVKAIPLCIVHPYCTHFSRH